MYLSSDKLSSIAHKFNSMLLEPEINGVAFKNAKSLEEWLQLNHSTKHELWVLIFKKDSGQQTITAHECLLAAIAWGWIDGKKKSFDEKSYLLRLTPRQPRSNWSKKNCVHAEMLISSECMHPSGLAQVNLAKSDGRWERAYSGSADMVIPDDFLIALQKNPLAEKSFHSLKRRDLFSIYLTLQTANCREIRNKRIATIIDSLAKDKSNKI